MPRGDFNNKASVFTMNVIVFCGGLVGGTIASASTALSGLILINDGIHLFIPDDKPTGGDLL